MKRRIPVFTLVCSALLGGAFITRSQCGVDHPKRAHDHFIQSDIYAKQGRFPEAIVEMKQAIVEEPKYFEARLGLSDIYQVQKRLGDSVAVLDEGIKRAPEDRARYLAALCDIFMVEKDYTQAIRYLRQSIEADSGNMVCQRQLGFLLERAKAWDEAETFWTDFHNRYPTDVIGARGAERARRLRAKDSRANKSAAQK